MTPAEIPYPAVFRDWRDSDKRTSVSIYTTGVRVEMYLGKAVWKAVVLTEEDACLMAAAMLRAAGRKKLSRRVLRKLGDS